MNYNKYIDNTLLKADATSEQIKALCEESKKYDFKSVCVMKFEHPEFWQNPVKRGKREVFHFKNWQEADKNLN